jgi:hypothetical protein
LIPGGAGASRRGTVPEAAYATVADFEAYAEGWVTTDEEALEQALHKASIDVDRYVGPTWVVEANGLRFGDVVADNPKQLTSAQLEALNRATCAQAEYRIEKGPDFFIHGQHETTSGPDFSTKGRLPRFGPKAKEELRFSGLNRALGGRLVS